MVIRRATPYGDEGPRRLAAFRRTRRQALGHGLFLGLIAGAVLLAAGLIVYLAEWADSLPIPPYPWLWLICALVVPTVVGGVVGTVTGVRIGVDADDIGLHGVPPLPRWFGPWMAIVDIRTERRRSRTVIAIYLESGAVSRLRAPYDGRVLSRDPRFERKYFTLLNIWETHRNWRSQA